MTIAVTGGSGKLGRGVIAWLQDAGYDVVNLDRGPAPGGPARPAGFIEIDLTDQQPKPKGPSMAHRQEAGLRT